MRKASFAQALANVQPDAAPALLFELDAQHMTGVIRITAADGFWERHNGGDEILVVLQGRMDFTFRYPDSTETLLVGCGDILHIPRGVAHGAKIYEEVHILFFTPKEGNTCWTEGEEITVQAVTRHQ
jgi:mannose-6-phosphate isomerase-like protein (cupin superfamily)